jgi:hypothetical protein
VSPPRSPGDAGDEVPQPSAHLEAALRTVYAALPDAFMAVRKGLVAQAKGDGDAAGAAAIGRLRKPSTAAWAVNLLAREEPGLVEELVDLGVRMRTAQSRLDTATLTSLRPERDRVVAGVVAAAARLVAEAGRTLSPAAQDDVRGTVVAALADEQASAAVTSGQLTRALSYSGFGEVDLSEAVVRTSSGSILSVVRGGTGQATGAGTGRAVRPDSGPGAGHEEDAGDEAAAGEEEAAARVVAAEAELEAAAEALSRAQDAVAAARGHAEETRERVAVVERQLAKAREADERALEAVTDAVRARKEAETARSAAEESLARLRAGVED